MNQRYSLLLITLCIALTALASGPIDDILASPYLGMQGQYGQTDLNEINHPDLFRWKWGISPATEHKSVSDATATDSAPSPKLDIKRPQRVNPIPLGQLDSSLVQRVHFAFDKHILTPEAKSGIQINTAWIKMHTEYDILLEGHCDERGSNEYNIALGDRRASAVRDYMIRQGIAPGRIMTRSYGEEKPLDVRRSHHAYALNRRVEFYAVP